MSELTVEFIIVWYFESLYIWQIILEYVLYAYLWKYLSLLLLINEPRADWPLCVRNLWQYSFSLYALYSDLVLCVLNNFLLNKKVSQCHTAESFE